MFDLPDFDKSFEYENDFYLSCDPSRIGKIIIHYELFKMTLKIPGDIVDCGVFKGVSLSRFATFLKLFDINKKVIGFDTFEKFPQTNFEQDFSPRDKFISDAGENCISTEQLHSVLSHKDVKNYVELVKGDITKSVPEYIKKHSDLKISLLNLDVDIYEPSVAILESLYPKLSSGGILILDDYEKFPGETKAVDDYFKDENIEILEFPFSKHPKYIIKK